MAKSASCPAVFLSYGTTIDVLPCLRVTLSPPSPHHSESQTSLDTEDKMLRYVQHDRLRDERDAHSMTVLHTA